MLSHQIIVMQPPHPSGNLATLALAFVLTCAVHGEASAQRNKPPPPPPPIADSNLQLVSTNTAGTVIDGEVCGLSAEGGKVLFRSRNGTFEPQQLFIKDFNGNTSTRVVFERSPSVKLTCLAMTPDANTVVFIGAAPNGVTDFLGREGVEPAIKVKNLLTGVETRITPMLKTLSSLTKFTFAGVSDDGQRVAFIGEPTFSCVLYSCTALGPTRMFVRDLGTGALLNLDEQVRLTSSQGQVDGNALLSPDGKSLAFSTRASYPELGDSNANRSDVFVLNLASNTVRLVTADANGQQLTIQGFGGTAVGPTYGVQSFLANSTRVAFRSSANLNVGNANIYAKDLLTGALTPVMPNGFSVNFPNVNVNGVRADLSFSDDGRKVAYVPRSNTNPQPPARPIVLDLTNGTTLNAATLTSGTMGNGRVNLGMLLSRDGRVTAFDNNSTNLVAGTSTNVVRTYRRLLP